IEMLDSFPGSYMPETKWLLYAENAPAPLCRKPGGSYMAEDDTGISLSIVGRVGVVMASWHMNRLTALGIGKLVDPGYHADGGGRYL
ncbi:hypothetical protein, partial [Burkholderia thailandensis]|uniref:hypothetical protein n=1 Tax=Burkholderia thailandensis TaxID=57975 RepID=UPI00217ECA24